MQRSLRMLVLLAAFSLLMSLGVGCGGGEAEPTATPTATPTETPEPTPTPPSPLGLDSFHYTVDVELTAPALEGSETAVSVQTEGDFVAPDSHAFTSSFQIGGISYSEDVVIVGDDAWIREGEGDWKATPRDALDETTIEATSADPDFFQDFLNVEEDLTAIQSETDILNGLSTRRYRIPREAVAALAGIFREFSEDPDLAGLEEFGMTVWVAEDNGALVRFEFSGKASSEFFGEDTGFDIAPDAIADFSMTINITQHNDSTISIEPPI